MLNTISLEDISNQFEGKRVLIRVDYNVLIKETNEVKLTEIFKIEKTIPTIKYVLSKGAKSVVLISHLDEPNGKVIKELSLKNLTKKLDMLLGRCVIFIEECVGDKVEKQIQENEEKEEYHNGLIFLLENLRFHKEEQGFYINEEGKKIYCEEKELINFREKLSKLGDIYINEAFNISHLNDSSITGINIERRVAGIMMKKEINMFYKLMNNPDRPLLAILGGHILSDKITLIYNLLEMYYNII